ncbi:hypothetical protein GUITHDRAFT_135031 [Guillardia theta CCMP2712]|uniref:FHA domain-containing protein n=1 Tax=Guillardia theta (strain CCMP2712) TaxID=905079 RepID=L1JSA0_GUITC|nr:hypothetical protein GUITHDRAFT_135031 [Guillardia theta CCMP2712]EKX50958.1 hypothetical protein GUITHDRAFT_135031 [Guillardia theta CCMP2712]|eukprot:XP_005837938.1 hypothetical protein GUITHDRAFT_135031 [Guillardia theta CCMP2712]
MVWVLVGGGRRLEIGGEGGGAEEGRKGDVRIGKSEDNDVVISHESVSRRHAVIGYSDRKKAVWLEDDSSNGTWVNGEKVERDRRIELANGSKIRFGEHDEAYVLELVDKSEGTKELLSRLEGYGDEDAEEDEPDSDEEGKSKVSITDQKKVAFLGKEIPLSSKSISGQEEVSIPGQEEVSFSGQEDISISGQEEESISGQEEESISGQEEESISGQEEESISGREEEKFLKLMGGKKPGNEAMAGKAPEAPPGDRASYRNMQQNLEKEFDEALRRSQGMGKFGLG